MTPPTAPNPNLVAQIAERIRRDALRDEFAKAAMTALIRPPTYGITEEDLKNLPAFASFCYYMADEMMSARERRRETHESPADPA